MEKASVKSPHVSKATRAFLISLVVLILCSLVNWGIVSDWGNVRIERLKLTGDNGQEYSALIYIPQNATNETPAPAIVMYHGGNGNARNHEAWSMEFARRGYVALSVDWNGAGNSETSTYYTTESSSNTDTCNYFYEYAMTCPFIDADRIISSGHSAGSEMALMVGIKYNSAAILACSGIRPLSSYGYQGNLQASLGSVEPYDNLQDGLDVFTENARLSGIDIPEGEYIEYDHIYGSFEEGNAHRYLIIDKQIHEGVFIDKNLIREILWFAQEAVPAPSPIDCDDQIWPAKDVVGLISMFAFLAFILCTAVLIMENVTFFQNIKQPMPRNIGLRGKGLAISIIGAVVFPIICIFTGSFGLTQLLGTKNTGFWFSMGQSNRGFSMVVGLTVLGILMLLLFIFTDGKKAHAKLEDFGLTRPGMSKLDFKLIGKCLLLAVIVIFIAFTYLSIVEDVLGTDIYCLFFGYKPIPSNRLIYYIPYIVVFMICFVFSAIGMNVERRLPSTGNETKDLIIAMVFNSLLFTGGVSIMIFIQNYMQVNVVPSGTFALQNLGIDVTRLWGMPVSMIIAGAGSTYLYRKSGSVWLGAFTMGILCALGCVLYGTHVF